MTLEKLVSKYIASAERALEEMEIVNSHVSFDVNAVKNVVDSAKDYLEDAKYYRDKNKLDVSLASVAYCEGLLDALRLLGAVKFEWKTRKNEKSEK